MGQNFHFPIDFAGHRYDSTAATAQPVMSPSIYRFRDIAACEIIALELYFDLETTGVARNLFRMGTKLGAWGSLGSKIATLLVFAPVKISGQSVKHILAPL